MHIFNFLSCISLFKVNNRKMTICDVCSKLTILFKTLLMSFLMCLLLPLNKLHTLFCCFQVNGGWVLASTFLWNVLSHAVLTGNHLWEETVRETLQQISVNAIEKISWMDHLSGVPHVGWSAKSLQLCYHLFTGLKDTITLLQH